MRLTWAFALIIAIQPVDGLAQQAESVQQSNHVYNLWLIRSQSTTEDLIKDAATLNSGYRALLWARLAELWWRDNPEKAGSWMAREVPSRPAGSECLVRKSAGAIFKGVALKNRSG